MNRTDGPWRIGRAISNGQRCIVGDGDSVIALLPDETMGCSYNADNARLITAAPTQHAEMVRFLTVLERAEADADLWARLTEGTGIATANAYRAAIAAATGETHER